MRAAVMRDNRIVVDDVPEPEPAASEVLVRTLACGICGSDLHALRHAAELVRLSQESGVSNFMMEGMDPSRDVVMGHEFCAEIVAHGPTTAKRLAVGTRVCSMPMMLRPGVGGGGVRGIGYSNDLPGGFGELMVLSEALLLPVPNGLSADRAALTEPMAVGAHAVEVARLQQEDVPLVIGCGPVGLSVISALKLRGASPIVAADFSERRRELATRMGADVVVDPAASSPYKRWQDVAKPAKRRPTPLFGGTAFRPAVIFECVGVPGIIAEIVSFAPRDARVIVLGVCMELDQFRPIHAITKGLTLQFVQGYSPMEFASTLQNIADNKIDVEPLITNRVGLESVAEAFVTLATPERHCKILIHPSS